MKQLLIDLIFDFFCKPYAHNVITLVHSQAIKKSHKFILQLLISLNCNMKTFQAKKRSTSKHFKYSEVLQHI